MPTYSLPFLHAFFFLIFRHYDFWIFVVSLWFVFICSNLFDYVSANSFPITPECALNQQSVIFHSLSSMYLCILLFCTLSNVVWLSVFIVNLVPVVSNFFYAFQGCSNCKFFRLLFVHFLFSLHSTLLMLSPYLYMAKPEPTTSSDLFPSLNNCIGVYPLPLLTPL